MIIGPGIIGFLGQSQEEGAVNIQTFSYRGAQRLRKLGWATEKLGVELEE